MTNADTHGAQTSEKSDKTRYPRQSSARQVMGLGPRKRLVRDRGRPARAGPWRSERLRAIKDGRERRASSEAMVSHIKQSLTVIRVGDPSRVPRRAGQMVRPP